MQVALFLVVIFLQEDFMHALRPNRRPPQSTRVVEFLLRGLRSATTSEELRKDPQFRTNGMWTTAKIEHGQKLALFLNSAAPENFPTSTSCKNAIRKGLVHLNGVKAHNTDIVAEGDVIESFVRSQQSAFCGNFEQKVIDDPSAFKSRVVQVLWEDDHCAVIIKPQGMPVFRTKESSGSDDVNGNLPCLQSALPYSLTPVPTDSGLEPLRRPQAVHRLDKGTGGLLLVAKTRPAMINLTAQFAARTVKKKYRAIVVGKLSNQSGTNNREDDSQILTLAKHSNEAGTHPPLAISGTISTMLSRQTALTEWSVQPGMQTKSSLHGWITTVDLSPHTGRTHQLRRHVNYLRSKHPSSSELLNDWDCRTSILLLCASNSAELSIEAIICQFN